jgi:hypothetical protein
MADQARERRKEQLLLCEDIIREEIDKVILPAVND